MLRFWSETGGEFYTHEIAFLMCGYWGIFIVFLIFQQCDVEFSHNKVFVFMIMQLHDYSMFY